MKALLDWLFGLGGPRADAVESHYGDDDEEEDEDEEEEWERSLS